MNRVAPDALIECHGHGLVAIAAAASREWFSFLSAASDFMASLLPNAEYGWLRAVARQCRRTLADSAYARRHGNPGGPTRGVWGYGLGITFEEPWIDENSEVQVTAGMCLAVEVRIGVPSIGGATHEDIVIVTDEAAEIITGYADESFG